MELARELSLTDNAVRAHLAALERDGLVEQRGVRRGVGKPAYVYELTEAGEELFPKGYAAVLAEVLAAVRERGGPAEVEALLREAGRRAAAQVRPSGPDLTSRLAAAADFLAELGADVQVEESDGTLVVRGFGCPLGSLVRRHPEVCRFVEALLAEVTAVPVAECCERAERPRCAFAIGRDGCGTGAPAAAS